MWAFGSELMPDWPLAVARSATRGQARADAARAKGALERVGPAIAPAALKTFARTARRRMRTESGGYRVVREEFKSY